MKKLVNEVKNRKSLTYKDIAEEKRWGVFEFVMAMVDINADNMNYVDEKFKDNRYIVDSAIKSQNLVGQDREKAEAKVLKMKVPEDALADIDTYSA